jgi:hypothetical protein
MNMKKYILIPVVFLFSTMSLFATVHTVTNNPIGGSQFGSLQAAYDAASNGDTIMLEGTNFNYTFNCIVITKSLTYVGIGVNPEKQNPALTKIAGPSCYATLFLSTGSSGSRFYGIEFQTSITINAQNISNIVFESCRFLSTFSFANNSASNFAFRNCVFDVNNALNITIGGTGAFIQNCLITNCIFDGFIGGDDNPLVTMLVDHCVFLGTSTFQNLQNAIIANSIFMNAFPSGTSNSTYNNNISRVAGTFPPAGGNTAAGNIENTDPQFTSYTLGQNFSTNHEYKLQPGSPAIAAGTDGTDLGVYGGNSNFSKSLEVLHHPIMRLMNIQNSTVAPSGTLNVQINASKPNDN